MGIQQNKDASSLLATSRVTVLAVTEQCTSPTSCVKTDPGALAYMGVGFDRNARAALPPPTGSNTNVFTSIVSLASGAPISTYRQGYIVSNSGVTLA